MTFFELCSQLGHVQDLLGYCQQNGNPLSDLTAKLEGFKRKYLPSIAERVVQGQGGNIFATIELEGQIESSFKEMMQEANQIKESLQGDHRQHIDRLSNLRKAVAEYYTKESEFIARMQGLDVQFYISKFQKLNGKVNAATLVEVTTTLREFSRLQNFLHLDVQECTSLIQNPGMGIMLLEAKFFRPDGHVLEHVERIRKLASHYLKILELINACAKAGIHEFTLVEQNLLAEPFQRLARYAFVDQLGPMLEKLEPCKDLFVADYYDHFQRKTITYGHARLCGVVQGLVDVATTQLKVFNRAEKIREFLEKRLNPALYDTNAPVNRVAHLLEFQKAILQVITEGTFSTWPDDVAAINQKLIEIGLVKFNQVFASGNQELCHDVLSDQAAPFVALYDRHLRKYRINEPKRDIENDNDFKIRQARFLLRQRIEAAVLQGVFLTKNFDQTLFGIYTDLSAKTFLSFDASYFLDNRVRLAWQVEQELSTALRAYEQDPSQLNLQLIASPATALVSKMHECKQAVQEFNATVVEFIESGRYLQFPDSESFLQRVLQLAKLIHTEVPQTLQFVAKQESFIVGCKAYTELLRCRIPAEVYTRIDHQSFEWQQDLHEAFPSDHVYQAYQRKTTEFFTRLEEFKDQAQNVAGGFVALRHRSARCFAEALTCSPADAMHFRQPQAYERAVHRAAVASCFPLQLYYLPDDPMVKLYQKLLQGVASDKKVAATLILNTMLAKGSFKFSAVLAEAVPPSQEACLTLLAAVVKDTKFAGIIQLLQIVYASSSAAQQQILREKVLSDFLAEIDLAATMDDAAIQQTATRLYDLLRDNFTTSVTDTIASYEVADHFGLKLSSLISNLSIIVAPKKIVNIVITDAYYTQSKITSAQLFSALMTELLQLVEDERYDQAQRTILSDLLTARSTMPVAVTDVEFRAEIQRLHRELETKFPQTTIAAEMPNNLCLDKVRQHMQSALALITTKTGLDGTSTVTGSPSAAKDALLGGEPKRPKTNPLKPLELTSPYSGRKMALGVTMLLFGLSLIGFAALAFFNPILIPVIGLFLASHMVTTLVATLLSASLGVIISLGGISVSILASQTPKVVLPAPGSNANPMGKLGSATATGAVTTDPTLGATSPVFTPAPAPTSPTPLAPQSLSEAPPIAPPV